MEANEVGLTVVGIDNNGKGGYRLTTLRLVVLVILCLGLALALRPGESAVGMTAGPGSGVETLELVGHFGGVAQAVFALDDLVLAGFGPEFAVFDRSDPENLLRLEYLMFEEPVSHIQASGSHAFVGEGDVVHVVDLSEPAAPVIVGSYQSPAAIQDMVVEGAYLYVAAGTAGLRVVDIAEPALPVEVTYVAAVGEVTAVDVDNQLAGIVDGGFRVIDVVNPPTPIEMGFYDQSGLTDMTMAGNYGYLVHGSLTIVDISDAANPVLAGQHLSSGESPISQVAVRENYAFLVKHGCPYGGDCLASFSSLDVSNPAAPVESSAVFFYSHFMYGVALADDYLYIAANTAGLRIMDISQPAEPGGSGSYGEFWNLGGVQAMSSPYLFVGMSFYLWWYETANGYKIVDIADPHRPVVRGAMEGGGLFFTDDGHAYRHEGNRHTSILYALDMSDPVHPIGTGSWGPSQTFIGHLLIGEDYVYATGDFQTVALDRVTLARMATHDEEMKVVYNQNGLAYANWGGDLHIYTAPFTEVNVVEDFTLNNFQVDGRYGYTVSDKLLIVDMINPVEPVVVGSFESPGYDLWGLQISGDYAYLATDNNGVIIVDISDPAAPEQVDFYPTAGSPRFLVVGGYLFIADGPNGIVVLSLANPADPVQVASYPKPNPYSLTVRGTHLYADYGADGVYILELYGIDEQFYVPLVAKGE
jgi:hypothetical protein